MSGMEEKEGFAVLPIIIVAVVILAVAGGLTVWILSQPQSEDGIWAEFNDEWVNCQPILTEEEQARCDEAERLNYPKIAY